MARLTLEVIEQRLNPGRRWQPDDARQAFRDRRALVTMIHRLLEHTAALRRKVDTLYQELDTRDALPDERYQYQIPRRCPHCQGELPDEEG